MVGNGSYQAGPLTNPPNDAEAVAKVLEEADFEVHLATDRTLREMEADLREFKESISKGDVALFFYAGHGVQVDGVNYLLPVNNGNIQDSGALRRRAIDAQEYVTAMADAGAKLNIVMLDACRDNPLPSTSRSASRGLAVMSAPRTSETVIVFATKAGDVAADGEGRNSTFTTAFLETVPTPDLGLVNLFNLVGAKVRSNTGGLQIPTIYSEPLSAPFSFFSAEKLAAEARAESREAAEEVDSLEADIQALKAKIAASQNEAERKKLELEEQRQAALLAAQKLKAENLAREAERREAEAAAAKREAERLAAEAEAAAARQGELERLASLRRTELEKLKSDAESEDPDLLIATIERLEKVLSEVEAEYDAAWRESEREIKASYKPRYAAINDAEPEGWESDEAFKNRVRLERAKLEKEEQDVLSSRKSEIDGQKTAQTVSIRNQLSSALQTLRQKRWNLTGSAVHIRVGEYQRNEMKWPFYLTSLDGAVPFPNFNITLNLSKKDNLKEAYESIEQAIKAEALVGQIDWKLERGKETFSALGETAEATVYYVVPTLISIDNLLTGKRVVSTNFGKQVAFFLPGYRKKSSSLWGLVNVTATSGSPEIFINGESRGSAPLIMHLLGGDYKAKVQWPNKISVQRDLNVTRGRQNVVFDISEAPIVFVEGGSFSMGSPSEGYNNELPVHRVTLDSFFMTKTEITFE